LIIATAGHVDHGKTSLIKQLTGIDTDRLEEEKRRGLSINLGFAYLPQDNGTRLGFIDVPGHTRFINTMISGVSARRARRGSQRESTKVIGEREIRPVHRI